MENIKHSYVEVKGLKLHVAEIESGQNAVVFLHGFPQMWYTWRHQMIAVANAGYRDIAFDFRGYGLSEHPAEPEKSTLYDLVDDVVGLLDSLGISKAFLVGKDFGAIAAYLVTVFHLEKVASLITLGVPFMLSGPSVVQNHLLPKGFYVARWQVPYRTTVDCGISDPKVTIPALLIMGEKDHVFKVPGMDDYIRSGAVKYFVPNLEIIHIQEGGHFVHGQFPEEVNQLIIEFLDNQSI